MEKKQIILLGVIVVFFWGGQYIYVPTLTPYAKSIGASMQMLGLIGGAYGLMQLIFRIPIGMHADMLQRRKPHVIAGISMIALAGALFLFTSSPVAVLFARSFTGIAMSFWAAFTIMFSSYFKDSVRAIGILNSIQSFGIVTTTLVGVA